MSERKEKRTTNKSKKRRKTTQKAQRVKDSAKRDRAQIVFKIVFW